MRLSQTARRKAVAVVFDGDDTLWSTEGLYDEARANARSIVAAAGLNPTEWERLERLIDVANVKRFGYSRERFPTSCVEAYRELRRLSGQEPDGVIEQRIKAAAETVFECDPPVFEGTRNALETLRSRGFRLALLTKGDRDVQSRRIERSGLRPFFDVIEIVADKTPEVFARVLASLGVEPASAWMVGNSVRSDVFPALTAGLRPIWIDAHVWEHERDHEKLNDDRVIVAASLSDIAGIIAP